ncbi:MAG TPA: hypothetical protein VG204_07615 [Terriglobia bacterium]|nr:hypothetical protein [Terriglobia bacterium]
MTPNPATITAGDSQSYTAQGVDSFGNPTGDVTSSTTFSIAPDGSCTGASCTASVAGAHTVTGTDGVATGMASLTVTVGSFAKLQLLVPGETAAPGTGSGKTGPPSIEYVNGPFNVMVNAVDQYWNVVTTSGGNPINDTVHFTSTDGSAVLPDPDPALSSGTGTFSVTLETVSNPASTTITTSDATDGSKTSNTSPAIEVIIVYTASISPADAGTGQATNYTLTVNNAAAPNANTLRSVKMAIPAGAGFGQQHVCERGCIPGAR